MRELAAQVQAQAQAEEYAGSDTGRVEIGPEPRNKARQQKSARTRQRPKPVKERPGRNLMDEAVHLFNAFNSVLSLDKKTRLFILDAIKKAHSR